MFHFLPDDPDLRRRTIDQLVWQLDVDIKRLWKRVEQAPGHWIGDSPLYPGLGPGAVEASSSMSSSTLPSCQGNEQPYQTLGVTISGVANNSCAACGDVNGVHSVDTAQPPRVGCYSGLWRRTFARCACFGDSSYQLRVAAVSPPGGEFGEFQWVVTLLATAPPFSTVFVEWRGVTGDHSLPITCTPYSITDPSGECDWAGSTAVITEPPTTSSP